METFLWKSITTKLRMVVEHHLYLGKCSQKKKKSFCYPTFSTMQRHTSTLFGKFLKFLQWGILLSLDTNGFLHQPLYSLDIFWRNLLINLIPFSMTTWVLLNFWNSNASIINCFLFTIDFKSLYTNIPVDDAIYSIKQLCYDFQNVIPNAHYY